MKKSETKEATLNSRALTLFILTRFQE